MTALVLLVGLTVAVGAGLLLYALVRQEHEQRQVVDRAAGERVARRDTTERRQSTDRYSDPDAERDKRGWD